MFRAAFTMIELIFVIVILGVLAAVGLPKLAATRDDAFVSTIAQNIAICASEIALYATSHAKVESNFTLMSNAAKGLESSGKAVISDSNMLVKISDGNCLNMKIVTDATTDTLHIEYIASTDVHCLKLQSLVDANKYPMKLRGTDVVY